jgi:hypothetical protein
MAGARLRAWNWRNARDAASDTPRHLRARKRMAQRIGCKAVKFGIQKELRAAPIRQMCKAPSPHSKLAQLSHPLAAQQNGFAQGRLCMGWTPRAAGPRLAFDRGTIGAENFIGMSKGIGLHQKLYQAILFREAWAEIYPKSSQYEGKE